MVIISVKPVLLMYYNKNFEEEFKQIMEGSNSQLQEYFRRIVSSQQISHPPSDWENAKKLFIETVDAAEI